MSQSAEACHSARFLDFIGCTSCRPFLHPGKGLENGRHRTRSWLAAEPAPRALRHRPHDLLRAIRSASRHAAEPAAAPAFPGQSFVILRRQRQAIVEALAFRASPPHARLPTLPLAPTALNTKVKTQRRTCAALAGKLSVEIRQQRAFLLVP